MSETVDNLSKYGTSYQIKAIGLLLDPMYLSKVYDVIRPSFFSSEAFQWIVKTIIKHYKEHRCLRHWRCLMFIFQNPIYLIRC